jgi:hypothetical protein
VFVVFVALLCFFDLLFDCYFDRKFWAQPDQCCQSGGSDCDARLDQLVNAPDWLVWHCIRHGEGPWPLLACRAAYVKLGVTGKYYGFRMKPFAHD